MESVDLKKKTIIGFVWTAIGTFGRGGLNLIITIILSRLLPPSDFGIIALLLVFNSVSTILIDSGFSQAIIRDQNISDAKLSSVFILNMVISIVLYVFLFWGFPLIGPFLRLTEYDWMARVVFLAIIFEAFALIQTTILTKNMNFKWLACSQWIATIAASFIAIIMALLGYKSWSLAMNIVLYSFFRSTLLWVRGDWHFRWKFHWSAIKEYLPFSINLMITGFFDRVMSSSEALFIGHYYTKADLGFFSRAREIDAWTSQTLTSVIVKVTYPALVQVRDDQKKFREAYVKIMGVVVFVNTFMMAFIIAAAEPFVQVLWGSAWLTTAEYLLPWCIFGIMFPFQSICINIFQAYGKTREFMYISGIRQIFRIIAILLFIQVSIYSMTWAIIVVAIGGIFFTMYFAAKCISYSVFRLLKDSFPTFIGALLSVGTIYLGHRFISPKLSFLEILLIDCIIMCVVYGVSGFLLRNQYFFELINILLSRIKRRKNNFL